MATTPNDDSRMIERQSSRLYSISNEELIDKLNRAHQEINNLTTLLKESKVEVF